MKGCVGKDPDAQGSGSETRDLLKEQAEIRVKHRQGSETPEMAVGRCPRWCPGAGRTGRDWRRSGVGRDWRTHSGQVRRKGLGQNERGVSGQNKRGVSRQNKRGGLGQNRTGGKNGRVKNGTPVNGSLSPFPVYSWGHNSRDRST